MNTTVLFDTPQNEISSLINSKLSACHSASIVAGFLTPSGVRAIAAPIRARPTILTTLVIGSSTYPGFQAIDDLLAMGVPAHAILIHLGHTRESDSRSHPIVRHHPMLHSKIYYMELPGDQACAFIGSHNLTSFALQGLNGEAAVLLEGPRTSDHFARIRNHIQIAASQAVPNSPHLKEAFAWWTQEYLKGICSDVALPRDWISIRTILIFAEVADGNRPVTGNRLYFELPAGIAIESLKTEVHLFLFNTLPPTPDQALQQTASAQQRFTCKVIGADNEQGNLELKANWRIEPPARPLLHRVPTGVHRPTTQPGIQQVRADVEAPFVNPYEYSFEREKIAWWPIFSDGDKLHPSDDSDESFAVSDTPWQKASDEGWKLVTGLKHGEGLAREKDALALALAKPESGSFILVSLRRRSKTRNTRQKET